MPGKTIEARGKFFLKGDYGELFELYSVNSPFKEFFTDPELYMQHMAGYAPCVKLRKIEIQSCRQRGKIAEVMSTEEFDTEDGVKVYHVKSYLNLEDGKWKIAQEKREITSY